MEAAISLRAGSAPFKSRDLLVIRPKEATRARRMHPDADYRTIRAFRLAKQTELDFTRPMMRPG
jgi:hypothetical protein